MRRRHLLALAFRFLDLIRRQNPNPLQIAGHIELIADQPGIVRHRRHDDQIIDPANLPARPHDKRLPVDDEFGKRYRRQIAELAVFRKLTRLLRQRRLRQ